MSSPWAAALGGRAPSLVLWAPGPRAVYEFEGLPGNWGLLLKLLVPTLGYLAAAPILWWFFRKTWRELDAEAADTMAAVRASGRINARPLVLCAIAIVTLTLQEYYGGRQFFYAAIRPWMRELEVAAAQSGRGFGRHIHLDLYADLYGFGWWAVTRVAGYALLPLLVWKIFFPRDSLLDLAGLRVRGLLKHAWIYGACLVVVIPLVFMVSRSPEFSSYYPFYKLCSRSWVEFISWELMYVAQFFALEIFFRGFFVQGLRKSLGSASIFLMCVPYVMIHFGKPYLETGGALIAGVALGSLAAKTKSIYSGFMVHVTVALLMDVLGVLQDAGLPTSMWPLVPGLQ